MLLIGDAAIRALTSGPPYPRITDLGIEWTRVDGPALRLRAVGREHARSPSERQALRQQLDRALDEGMAALPEIAATHGATGLERGRGARPT